MDSTPDDDIRRADDTGYGTPETGYGTGGGSLGSGDIGQPEPETSTSDEPVRTDTYGTDETYGGASGTGRPAHRAESHDAGSTGAFGDTSTATSGHGDTYDESGMRTEADRIRSDDIVEPAALSGTHAADTGMRTEADRIRSDDIAVGDPYAVVIDDEDGLTDADRLRARGIDDEPEVIAPLGDEDALLTDAEKIQARDIDQS